MTAESIARALGGRRAGAGWMAHCPAHEDRTPSLSIQDSGDGTVLVHCHAGCGQETVITALRACGLWPKRRLSPRASVPPKLHRPMRTQTLGDARRTEDALQIWQASVPARGTLVETYLKARGISIPVPSSLRFHTRLKHPSGEWPVMIGLVTRGSDPVAIHRTFLARNGTGKAPVDPQKMMLGPCRGGAVRLADADSVLMVGEGIETCLSVMQATGYPAWAALSAPGLRALELPTASATEVIILADGDDPGEKAARDCAWRWKREGRRVRIARPPHGLDFNDVLLGEQI